jgi:Cu+-exporting ATPase
VLTAAAWKESDVLALAAGLEKSSEHPLARAVVTGAGSRDIEPAEVSDFQSITGRGVTGVHSGRRIALGNAALMQDAGASTQVLQAQADALRGTGRTVMFLAIDGTLAGAIAVGDSIKHSTPAALKALREDGLRVVSGTSSSCSSSATASTCSLGLAAISSSVIHPSAS